MGKKRKPQTGRRPEVVLFLFFFLLSILSSSLLPCPHSHFLPSHLPFFPPSFLPTSLPPFPLSFLPSLKPLNLYALSLAWKCEDSKGPAKHSPSQALSDRAGGRTGGSLLPPRRVALHYSSSEGLGKRVLESGPPIGNINSPGNLLESKFLGLASNMQK